MVTATVAVKARAARTTTATTDEHQLLQRCTASLREAMAEGLALLTPDARVLDVNTALARQWGLDERGSIGPSLFALIGDNPTAMGAAHGTGLREGRWRFNLPSGSLQRSPEGFARAWLATPA